jgi:SAM-dependent methyltransferase
MKEQTKSHKSRLRNNDYEFLKGLVLDIGCGSDPIKLDPPSVVVGWDKGNGDAQYLMGLDDSSFDAVVSYHCLEHMKDVPMAMSNWSRVLKKGGHLLICVPSWTFYERKIWPSRYNRDHKASFDLVDPEKRPSHPFYSFKEMRKIGEKFGLCIFDARLELDGYDLEKTNQIGLDQTRLEAQAQVTFIFAK